MMASPSELGLDFKPHHSYSMLLKSIGEVTEQTQNLEEFLARLEEERLKIDAFKRELPLCMQLLTNTMEASRQQLQTYQETQGPRPILEEFIPLKNSSSEASEKSSSISDKATWMTSAQLWSQESDGNKQQSIVPSPKETDIGLNVSPKLGLETKQRNGGAFLPFSKEKNLRSGSFRSLTNLAILASDDKDMEVQNCFESENGIPCLRRENCNKGSNGDMVMDHGKGGGGGGADLQTTTTATTTTSQSHRKSRRCWSPDLHQRFVNALQLLGGSQVATPKQIRELMKVEGLTNDEVKSHLQKYRLHTRRPCPNPQAGGTPTPQLLVFGRIWVPPEYAAAAAAAHHGDAPTLYGSHPSTHASTRYCTSQIPQEFYHAPPPPPPQPHQQLHHHTLHQLHMYNPSSQNHSSPESDIRGGTGDQSVSIEDGKSESSSWKVDSGGENGGETKRLVVREGDEESNGSEITLKF